jgi:hypothetical protein
MRKRKKKQGRTVKEAKADLARYKRKVKVHKLTRPKGKLNLQVFRGLRKCLLKKVQEYENEVKSFKISK